MTVQALMTNLRSSTMPEDAQQPYASFVMRIWREPGDPPTWRGSIQHVQSGHKCYFQTLERPMEFIENTLDETDNLRYWQPIK